MSNFHRQNNQAISMESIIDREKVLAQLAADDKQALEKLYDFYYPRLYSFSKKILKIEDGIDDILQEIFLKIWQNRKKIKQAQTFDSFIFTITKNLLLNELRSYLADQRRRQLIFERSVSEEYQLLEQIEYSELQKQIEQIISSLPPQQREVYQMSRTEGLSHKEIAQKLNISTKTVEYHISQSIKTLKKRLQQTGVLSLLYFYLFL